MNGTPITTKHDLFSALATGGTLFTTANREIILSSVQSAEREDGSGRNWNVRGYLVSGNCQEPKTIFVKTID